MNEILFAYREPLKAIGIAGIMAASPGELPTTSMRKWMEALREAIDADGPSRVRDVLAEAVPEPISNSHRLGMIVAQGHQLLRPDNSWH